VQEMEEVPSGPADVLLQAVATEHGVIPFEGLS
jgi:hypothetical protein